MTDFKDSHLYKVLRDNPDLADDILVMLLRPKNNIPDWLVDGQLSFNKEMVKKLTPEEVLAKIGKEWEKI